MGRGHKPPETADAFNAREVIEFMGPQIHESIEDSEGVTNNVPLTRADSNSGRKTEAPPTYKSVYSGVLDLDHDADNP